MFPNTNSPPEIGPRNIRQNFVGIVAGWRCDFCRGARGAGVPSPATAWFSPSVGREFRQYILRGLWWYCNVGKWRPAFVGVNSPPAIGPRKIRQNFVGDVAGWTADANAAAGRGGFIAACVCGIPPPWDGNFIPVTGNMRGFWRTPTQRDTPTTDTTAPHHESEKQNR